MNSRNHSINQKIIENLELPKDIVLGMPILTFQGNSQLTIENHRGLLQYDSDEIKVRTKSFIIRIIGKKLMIQEYNNGLIAIEGCIEGMQYII